MGIETDSASPPRPAALRHDLRTRLNQIAGYSEMLIEDAADSQPDTAMLDVLNALHRTALETVNAIERLIPSSLESLDSGTYGRIRTGLRGCASLLVQNAGELCARTEPFLQPFGSRILLAASELAGFVSGDALPDNSSGGPGAAAVPPAGRARLLVVDDNASNRELLSSQLDRLGYSVSNATNGLEALSLLRGAPFDVVLLDVRMPQLDGFQTLAILQSDEILREIPVIMISASDEYESVIRCIEGGAEDYLAKPFDAVLLRARLKASLEKKSLRDQQRQRAKELETAYEHLRDMQDQLVTQEKLASLGSLAAGIAHEIKNPLNFVTNFASLSSELAEELEETLGDAAASGVKDILADLRANLERIEEHGKRADGIVRGMLMHSRKQSGERDSADLNALALECVQLAYHGLRSQDMTFNAAIETDLDRDLGRIDVFPQDMSRVFLNLAANAFYSVHEKKKLSGPAYRPAVLLKTRKVLNCVEVTIRDNGGGIPSAALEKVFEPFYTTKPSGAGTGLGLSISHDIVAARHKGELRVQSQEGEFAEFTVSLPRDSE